MSLPALYALRNRARHAHIAVLARPSIVDLYRRESFADELIPYTAARGPKDLATKWRVASGLRARQFDTAILLQNAFEAAALVWLAGIPRRIGYNRDGRGWLLSDPVPVPAKGEIPLHERFYYLELLRRASILDTLPESEQIRLSSANVAAQAGQARFERMGWRDVVGMSPGAAYGGAKRWLPERFADAGALLGGPVALFGSNEERALCEGIATVLQRDSVPVYNFAGETSLSEFVDLAAACRVFVTNDSGGMHIASALGVPTVAIFGATDHIGTGPTGPLARVVREPVECSPCLLRECPIDHRCMTRVSAAQVAQAAKELAAS